VAPHCPLDEIKRLLNRDPRGKGVSESRTCIPKGMRKSRRPSGPGLEGRNELLYVVLARRSFLRALCR
jgi:hypothetical protein